MRMSKDDVPVKVEAPGARARQQLDFGDASGYGKLSGEHFSFAAGTDITALLKGLEGDLCQSPHWGYLISGELNVRYHDGSEESPHGGDLLYWPPGHTVEAITDAEFVLFSPQHEHTAVLDHIKRQLQ